MFKTKLFEPHSEGVLDEKKIGLFEIVGTLWFLGFDVFRLWRYILYVCYGLRLASDDEIRLIIDQTDGNKQSYFGI